MGGEHRCGLSNFADCFMAIASYRPQRVVTQLDQLRLRLPRHCSKFPQRTVRHELCLMPMVSWTMK